MINNDILGEEERGNGQKYIGLKIKMNRDCVVDENNWDGKLVNAFSALYVE